LSNPDTNNNYNGSNEIEVTDNTTTSSEEDNSRSSNHRTSLIPSPAPKGLLSSLGAKTRQQLKHGISQFGVKPMELIQEDLHKGVDAFDRIGRSIEKIGNSFDNGIFGTAGLDKMSALSQQWMIFIAAMTLTSYTMASNAFTTPDVETNAIHAQTVVNTFGLMVMWCMVFLISIAFSQRVLMHY
jgi:hypothetical protein